jgi:invasion protein IalB
MKLDRRIMGVVAAGLLLSPVAALAQDAGATPATPAPASEAAGTGSDNAATPAPAAEGTDATPAAGGTATPAAPAEAAPAAGEATPAAPAAGTTPAPAAGNAAAPAQPIKVPEAVQAWAKFCDPDPKDQHKVCIVRKLVFSNASIVGSLVLRVDSKKGVPTLAVAAVPVGVVLKPGLRWQIDRGKPQVLPFWRCTPQSCESEQLVRPDFINRLRKGNTLSLTAKDVNNKDFVVKVSLAGFAAAYDNPNPPTFKEYTESLPK